MGTVVFGRGRLCVQLEADSLGMGKRATAKTAPKCATASLVGGYFMVMRAFSMICP